jgi:hypothetical protein
MVEYSFRSLLANAHKMRFGKTSLSRENAMEAVVDMAFNGESSALRRYAASILRVFGVEIAHSVGCQ